MAYLWGTMAGIQIYLDDESTIQIGDNYDDADAQIVENAIVREVVEYLSPVYVISESDSSALLGDQVNKLTAAQIGIARMGSTLGNDLAPWTLRLQNQAWAVLMRGFVSQSLTGILTKDVPLWKRFLLAKSRERAIIPNA